jgi:hypothetical protein
MRDGAKDTLTSIGLLEGYVEGKLLSADSNYHSEAKLQKGVQEKLDASIPDPHFRNAIRALPPKTGIKPRWLRNLRWQLVPTTKSMIGTYARRERYANWKPVGTRLSTTSTAEMKRMPRIVGDVYGESSVDSPQLHRGNLWPSWWSKPKRRCHSRGSPQSIPRKPARCMACGWPLSSWSLAIFVHSSD